MEDFIIKDIGTYAVTKCKELYTARCATEPFPTESLKTSNDIETKPSTIIEEKQPCTCQEDKANVMFELLSARYLNTEREVERIYQEFAAPNTIKGKSAEGYLMEKLSDIMPDCSFTDTSKQGHVGDFHINSNRYSVMVECKNYGEPVPTKEVIKFREDLIGLRDSIRLGVLVSVAQRITGLPAMHVELDPINNQLSVFVSNFSYDEVHILPILIKIAELLHGCAAKETEEIRRLDHSREVLTKCAGDIRDASQKMGTYLTKAKNKCSEVLEEAKLVESSMLTLNELNLND